MTNGADSIIATALDQGIEVCFANPGTTEMPLVAALDRAPRMRPVLALHETVCTGAADGYARVAGKPALTLLHLGPGLANGAANLHNARRAVSPVVNLVGEHATWHKSADAPLAMDIEGLARTFSAWVGTAASADDMGRLAAEAVAIAKGRRAIATLIAPHDLQAIEVEARSFSPPRYAGPSVDFAMIEAAATALRQPKAALYLGGAGLFGVGLERAGRVAAATGCTLIAPSSYNRLEVGRGLPTIHRLPYFATAAQAYLDGFTHVVGCGVDRPVSFFGWPGEPSRYLEGREGVIWLSGLHEDALPFLDALVQALDAKEPIARYDAEMAQMPSGGPLTAETLVEVLAVGLPEDAILIPTAVTTGFAFAAHAGRARPHTQLALTGGAIGMGPSLAVGAAIGAPGRKIVNLEADGSGAYALQAFWTQAREGLDVTTIICHNRVYKILQIELERAGLAIGEASKHLTELDRPALDWTGLARSLGLEAEKVDDVAGFAAALERGLATPGPYLIEAMI
ncbi:acetolactate synthase-1/2/3 large subunit [Arboricoccus pini]|uniref:Acetolactate synthase-1/2/3 large subunit n=1 Tax=Arboricoccus pini TaxID=1963835 RepID=A0A212Q7B5_9PROT|nr:acetolactate synthase large subunit [Arboricoccus pini]SNB55227.1 acetolactate synthase-1/2/3 large subunit [Arboricoccus pini]